MEENITKSFYGFSQEEIKDIRNMLDPSNILTWPQLKVFLFQCEHAKLDPRLRQIYAIPRWNKNTNRHELTTVTTIDGFRLIAERTGRYSPGKPTEYIYDSDKNLIGATAYVKKLTSDGTWHEISETAFIAEYKPTDTKKAFFWIKMPHVMIGKVAEQRSIRRAFPDILSGIYGEEEMDQSKNKEENKTIEKIGENVCAQISQDQADLLESMLQHNHTLKQNILSYMAREYGTSELKEMPKELFDRVVLKAKSQYQPVVFAEEEQQAMGV